MEDAGYGSDEDILMGERRSDDEDGFDEPVIQEARMFMGDQSEVIPVVPGTGAASAADSGKEVPKDQRKTTRFLTKFEKARVLGARALQISLNAPIMVANSAETDPLLIARMELRQKKIPFVIRRYLPDGSYEDWRLEELSIQDY